MGAPGERAGREHGPQRVERVQVRPQLGLDVAHEVEDVAVALDLHVLAGGHGARPRDAAEVVAPEVHEHHVLGALLGVAAQLVGQAVVLGRRRAARPRAGDGVRGHAVADDLEQQLGARADDLERGRAGEEQVRRRVDAAQRAIQADAVDRLAVGPVGEVERLAPGEHDLDRLAGGDRVLRVLDGLDVLVAAERDVDLAGTRSRPPRPSVSDRPPEGRRHLGPAGPRGPLQGLEDRALGDPVAALEVGRPRCAARRSPTAGG